MTKKLWELKQLLAAGLDSVEAQQVFYYIARHPGVTQLEICEALGLARTTCSRLAAVLSDKRVSVNGKVADNLRLIEFDENDLNRREKLLSLTKKGQKLLSDIQAVIG